MEAGLPDVTASNPELNAHCGDTAAPAGPGLSGDSTVVHPGPRRPGWQGEHALGKPQAGISLHPIICSTAAVHSALYSSVFLMGFGNDKVYSTTKCNQLQPTAPLADSWPSGQESLVASLA